MEKEKKSKKLKTVDLAYIGLFAAIIAVCSWIQIPMAVPFTLQTFGVCLATALLGTKRGTLSVLTFIILGLIGVPVFAGFSGGPGVLFGMTGGYILGFIFTALIVGILGDLFRKKLKVKNAAIRDVVIYVIPMILGITACYAFGTAWFIYIYGISLGAALGMCVVPFIIPDLVKIVLATLIVGRVKKFVK